MRGQLFTPISVFENAVKVESGIQRTPRALTRVKGCICLCARSTNPRISLVAGEHFFLRVYGL
jgi:hypothetical protein